MTTGYNGRERPRSTPTYPPYSGKLTKVTGEGEQVELAFTADDAEQLHHRLEAAGSAASARLKSNNDTIVRAGATFEERQRQVYDGAIAQLRQEIQTMTPGRRPDDDEHLPPDDEPADEKEPVGPPAPGDTPAEDDKSHADAAAGSLHAPTDP